jgi:hypothetical protein
MITYTFYARKAGKSVIPGFLVSDGSSAAMTEPVLLSTGVFKNRVFSVPLEARWICGVESVFIGEPVSIVLSVYNQERILLLSDVNVSSPDGGLFEELPGGGEITREDYGPLTLYTIPVRAFLYTPSKTGRVTIDDTMVESAGSVGTAPGFSLTVLPVPDGIADSGAIGSLSFTSTISTDSVEQGGEFTLTMRVSGIGNLNYLRVPAPEITGANLLEKQESSSFSARFGGYEGERRVVYRLAAASSEQVSIVVPSFAWLDREQGVRRTKERTYRIKVRSAVLAKPEFPFHPKTEGRFLPIRGGSVYRERRNYLFLVIGPGVFLLLSLVSVGGREPTDQTAVHEGARLFSEGEYARAAESFAGANPEFLRVPELLYNLSMCSFQRGDHAEAVWYARESVSLAPMGKEYRKLLAWYEDSLSLDQQGETPPAIHPDLIFFLLLVFVSLGSIIGIVNLAKGRGFLLILLILSFALAGISGGILYGVGSAWAREVGIVKQVVMLKRIPKETAGPWIDLPEGMAVHIEEETESYFLIETGFGIRGWVKKEDLLLAGGIRGDS